MARSVKRAGAFAAVAIGVLATVAPAEAAPEGEAGARCMRLVRETIGFSADMNPGNTTFRGGTEGPDVVTTVDDVDPNVVFCGFGGDDYLSRNYGVFIGGAGDDTARYNHGTFYGGDGDDRVEYQLGTFNGEAGNDLVEYNESGVFNGGDGNDAVYENLWNSVVNGGPGDDWVDVNEGTFNGGPGNDTVYNNTGTFNQDG